MTKLKPCPFCNGEANIGTVKYSDNCEEVELNNRNTGYFGQCIQCSVTMQQGLSYETVEIATNKWNKRFVTLDKNGKDVFAGDSVKSGKRILTIVWDEENLQWKAKEAGYNYLTPLCQWAISEQFELIESKENE